jgi:hypothetical protein
LDPSDDRINLTIGEEMSFINQYSFLVIAGLAAALLGYFLFRNGVDRSSLITFGSLILGLLLAYFLLRPGSSPALSVSEILSKIGSGKPVLLEFQSEY